MKPLRKIRELYSRISSFPNFDSTYCFPYKSDKLEKRKEIWENLQKGLLLEDKKTFIPWETPFNQLDNFKEKRRDSGDRTEWFLGKHKILDGYESHLTVMMWMYLPWKNPFERVSEFLGFGIEGHENFKNLVTHLKNLLGEPTSIKIEVENDSFTEGSYEWINNEIAIQVIGFDMHGARYLLNIGLVRNRNEEYLSTIIENLKAQGLTEEELGK